MNMIEQDPWCFVPVELFESQLFEDMVKFISRNEGIKPKRNRRILNKDLVMGYCLG
jgi:hypothetical protein